jgi:nitroreductase
MSIDTSSVLAEAARAAGHAPSIHNTQPWRWRVGRTLDLYSDRARQLGVGDPDGRLLLLSCGAALHHALVALAAEGWRVEVRRLPDDADPDLLASVELVEPTAVEPSAMRLLQTMAVRRTDRRPLAGTPVDPEVIARVERVIRAAGARLHVLGRDNLVDLASAAAQAQAAESLDPEFQAELEYWAGGARTGRTGVPDAAIPARTPDTTVPGRDFGRPGTLPISAGHDSAAVYAIIYGDDDTSVSWLRAGEALSAGWLEATELGLSVVPLSGAIEVVRTRQALRRLLSEVGCPYLVLRLGYADPDHAGPPHAPRLPVEQVVEVLADDQLD